MAGQHYIGLHIVEGLLSIPNMKSVLMLSFRILSFFCSFLYIYLTGEFKSPYMVYMMETWCFVCRRGSKYTRSISIEKNCSVVFCNIECHFI